MDRTLNKLGELKTRLAGILQSRRAALSSHDAAVKKADEDLKKLTEHSDRELAVALEANTQNAQQQQDRIEARWKSHGARARKAAMGLKAKLERQINERKNAWTERRQLALDRAIKAHEAKRAEFEAESAYNTKRLDAMTIAVNGQKDDIVKLARKHGVKLDTRRPRAVPQNETEFTLDTFDAHLNAFSLEIDNARKTMAGPISALTCYAISLALCFGLWGALFKFDYRNPLALGIVGLFLILCIVIFAAFSSAKERVTAVAAGLLENSNETSDTLGVLKILENDRYMAGIANLGCERVENANEAEEKSQQQMMEDSRPLRDAVSFLQERRDGLLQRVQLRRDKARKALADRATLIDSGLKSKRATVITTAREQHAANKLALVSEKTKTIERLAGEWKSALTECQTFIDDMKRGFLASHPSWSAPEYLCRLPNDFSKEVPVGTVSLDTKTLAPDADSEGPFSLPASLATAIPVVLSFPLCGSLYIRAGASRRDDAMKIVSSTVLNLLRSFPPAKTKLTIIDPIGLGQNFAGLMHLADYDETLVNGRIWSDGAHIERKLTELTEHMEKVIQKFLRNRYASIDDYNIEAGQMAEPYRFVVIGDFPTGFSEMALERLASIVKSGVRCGVYTVILQNSALKLPPNFDLAQLKKNGIVLAERGANFVYEEDALNFPRFEADALPSTTQIDAFVNAVGKQCREAARVQVPFDVVLPKPDQYWLASTELSVRVPLGKSGADRLQHLELGRGTAQHALIAGKTGSGKSNLFHVVITNAASWYSPRELEFYLIDFKKGVEFKTYGVHHLRHARVVAIESDREFALSVLQRIDRELTHRGELFRKARVQDFPSFRKACPTEIMPRTLLMIDEFQEFFTDDDSVAQEAALLLDRIVRQGRAFGIHVILGSQTLGGTYTLSKSTLGQVVVRIALQCSEADSYLVLSDDNAAASLLTRPGDAIYNDMAGMIEGNNPFQAVWLPKDTQDACLRILQRKAVEGGMEAVEPLVVFEGNSLSDIRNNLVLRNVALQDAKAEATPRIWLGEPNAIKGPTEVQFGKQAGSNLLILGHRGDTEIAMCCSTLISLAAAYSSDAITVKILDGARPDSPARERLNQLIKLLPHEIELCDYRRTPAALQELAAMMKSRQEQDGTAEKRVFVLVLGLEKFRMLRQEDEFSFSSSSEEGGPSASKAFTDLLLEGPNAGMHSLVWCDTLSNLNRSLSRKTLREFEMRVLFQMSASDSSELIDNPAANRLGMYNALFYSASNGAMEKFRPYEAPGKDFIEDFARILSGRKPLVPQLAE